MMKRTNTNKRNGRLPQRGLPAKTLVGGKLNIAEVNAMKEAMRVAGIPTKSLFIAHAVRAFVKANGIDIQDVDPAQTFLPIGR
jgi:hypothetical protein